MTEPVTHEIMEIEGDDEGVPVGPVSPDVLRSGLESENASVRTRAATVASGLTETDEETVVAVIPELLEALYDEQRVVIYQSLMALSQVAEDEADQLEPEIDRLVELTVHDLALIRMIASRTVGYVALERPELFTDHVETLVEATVKEPEAVFEDETLAEEIDNPERMDAYQEVNQQEETRQSYTRNVTINLLIEVAEYDASCLEPYADDLVGLLKDQDATVSRGAAEIVGKIARENPDAVEGAVDPLVDMLSHHDESIVATAITALGFIGDSDAVEPLEALADEGDQDEAPHSQDLYDLAAETATFLDA
jgi:HEAT repeat protein